VIAAHPELMTASLESDEDLGRALSRATAVVVGPGLGRDDRARRVVEQILRSLRVNVIIDADAISMFEGREGELAAILSKGTAERALFTPHSGELGRLLGMPSTAVEADRFAAVRAAASRSGAFFVLKGAHSLLSHPDGSVFVARKGSAALATAGSGDVLAGIAGAMATDLPVAEAGKCAVYLHARAGELWEQAHGDRGALALDIAARVPDAVAELFR
jgi:NAD(P)H-hydrate epimerase